MGQLNKHSLNKLAAYFKQRLGMYDYRRGWMKGDCPSCKKPDKFGVNLVSDRTNCFSCSWHPRPLSAIKIIENLETIGDAWKFVGTFDDVEFLEPPLELLEAKKNKLPESFRLLSFGSSMFSKLARKSMSKRGFDVDELTLKGIGYCTRGDYAGRIVLPYISGGEMVYYTARKFIDQGPKFKNPKTEDFGIGKKLLMYNVDSLAIYKKIYIVESVTNALTLGDNAIALGGKVLSQYQKNQILLSPVERVVFLYDPDAYWYALHDALTLVAHKKVKIVLLDGKDDVNDIGKKETIKYVNRTEWLAHNELMKLFHRTERPSDFYKQ